LLLVACLLASLPAPARLHAMLNPPPLSPSPRSFAFTKAQQSYCTEKARAMMSDNEVFYFFVAFLMAAIASIIIYIFQPALTRAQFNSDNITFEKIGIRSNQNNEEHSYLLSLVVPAYNEEDRLPPMLTSTLEFLHSSKDELIKLCNESLILGKEQRKEYGANTQTPPFEIIIVNDGSSDGMVETLKHITEKEYNYNVQATTAIKLLTLKHNAGKGAAVKAGMLHCNAKLALMLDADGATNITSLDSLLKEMKASRAHMVFGSRAHLQEKSKADRSFVRTLLMKAFHFFVEFLIGNQIKDTQVRIERAAMRRDHDLNLAVAIRTVEIFVSMTVA